MSRRVPQRHEVEAWLGPALDEMSNRQVANLHLRIIAYEREHGARIDAADGTLDHERQVAWINAYEAVRAGRGWAP